MITLYGIPNCDTVKKARVWLDEHQLSYQFHDFKKQGISAELVNGWLATVSWTQLINKQGTTWRKLNAASQAAVVDDASAIALMLAQPSVIKRPVLVYGATILVGFKPDLYASLR